MREEQGHWSAEGRRSFCGSDVPFFAEMYKQCTMGKKAHVLGTKINVFFGQVHLVLSTPVWFCQKLQQLLVQYILVSVPLCAIHTPAWLLPPVTAVQSLILGSKPPASHFF